ncbi:pyrroline-5-carboxylate reductase [Enterococcus olivae]
MSKIGFYGAGNMARAIIQGMLQSGSYKKEDILVYNHRYEPTLKKIEEDFQIVPILEEKELFAQAKTIIFAVKPPILLAKLPRVKESITEAHVLVSIAAGVTLEQMEEILGERKILRAMPNTPATVGEGMTSVSANKQVSKEETEQVLAIFQSFGRAKQLPETQMDAIIGVSGSSPAYVYLFIEALADGAVLEGMKREDAYEMAAQAVLGAAKMVLETKENPGKLKDMVCSPGGTTIEAVRSLEENGFRAAVIQAVQAAAKKNREL